MNPFLTTQENLIVSVIFRILGESRFNRTLAEYASVAARVPAQKILLYLINRALEDMAIAGYSWEYCEVWTNKKTNMRSYKFVGAPIKVGRETLRTAWVKSGMRDLQKQA